MPRTKQFGLEVLVGGKPVTEYEHEGKCYVESDLHDSTHSTVKILQQPSKDGHQEQAWPVTPFTVRLFVDKWSGVSSDTVYHAKLFVDGFQSSQRKLKPGQTFISDGFAEFENNNLNIRQYCFSLPRYAQSKDDKISNISPNRTEQIGTIRAEFYETRYIGDQLPPWRPGRSRTRKPTPAYVQATKCDALAATRGTFTACTTMPGDVTKTIRLPAEHGNSQYRRRPWYHSYQPTQMILSIDVYYRMGHDLIEMGLKDAKPVLQEEDSGIKEEDEEEEEEKVDLKECDLDDKKCILAKWKSENKENLPELASHTLSSCDRRNGGINEAALRCSVAAANLSTTTDTSGNGVASNGLQGCPEVTRNLENIDLKCNIKLEPERGIINLDEEEYDSDCLELMDSYIMVSDGEEDDVYIVEDLIDPSILEIEDSILESETSLREGSQRRRSSHHYGGLAVPD